MLDPFHLCHVGRLTFVGHVHRLISICAELVLLHRHLIVGVVDLW